MTPRARTQDDDDDVTQRGLAGEDYRSGGQRPGGVAHAAGLAGEGVL